jgi:tetratricopeptide (TPR) repeat protein
VAVEAASRQLGMADRLTAGLFEALDPASHLYDYFRALAVLASPPTNEGQTSDIDWCAISEADWSAPIVVEVLSPERTIGGISVRDNRLTIDLTYGIEQRRIRKASGDFRMGALPLIELAVLQASEHPVDRATPSAVAAEAAGRRQLRHDQNTGDPFELGNRKLAIGDLRGAENEFGRADKLGNAAASVNLGNLRAMAGDLKGARTAFRRAERRGNSNGTLNLGVLLLNQGDLHGAKAAFRRADAQGNPSAPAYLGTTLADAGDLEGAEAAYRRADSRGNAAAAFALAKLLRARGDHVGADQARARGRAREIQSGRATSHRP